MKNDEAFITEARAKVYGLIQEYYERRGMTMEARGPEDVFVVWSCKTLQNRKAILSAHGPDRLIFEVTYNGDRREMYVDTYDKIGNNCFRVDVG